MIYPKGDLCAVFLYLFVFEFTYNIVVADLFAVVDGDIPVPYDVEGVGSFGMLLCAVWYFSNALSEATHIFFV